LKVFPSTRHNHPPFALPISRPPHESFSPGSRLCRLAFNPLPLRVFYLENVSPLGAPSVNPHLASFPRQQHNRYTFVPRLPAADSQTVLPQSLHPRSLSSSPTRSKRSTPFPEPAPRLTIPVSHTFLPPLLRWSPILLTASFSYEALLQAPFCPKFNSSHLDKITD